MLVATKVVDVKELIFIIFLLAFKIKALSAKAVPFVIPDIDPKLVRADVILAPPTDILVAEIVSAVI